VATTLTPALYIDPNAVERRKATEPSTEKTAARVEPAPKYAPAVESNLKTPTPRS